jgi:hypothetical protein
MTNLISLIEDATAFDIPESGSHECVLDSIQRSQTSTGLWVVDINWRVVSGTSLGIVFSDRFWVKDTCLNRWATFLKFLSGTMSPEGFKALIADTMTAKGKTKLFPKQISSHRVDEPTAKPESMTTLFFRFHGLPATITGKRETFKYPDGKQGQSFNVAFAGWKLDPEKVAEWSAVDSSNE